MTMQWFNAYFSVFMHYNVFLNVRDFFSATNEIELIKANEQKPFTYKHFLLDTMFMCE